MKNQKQFNNFTYNTKCNIWRISFNNIDKEYNIRDYYSNEYNITSFNNSIIYKGICINELNDYYREFCVMYYVWKNNLKSDIVGFDQYRRQWHNIDFNNINEDKIQVYSYWHSEYFSDRNDLGSFLYNFIIYIKFNYPEYKNKINYLLHNHPMIRNHINIFICKWETFCKICNIIFGFLENVMPHEQWKNKDIIDDYVEFTSNFHINMKENVPEYILHNKIYYPCVIEILLGTICNIVRKSFECGKESNYYILYNCNNINDCINIIKTYSYNVGNGINYIFVNNGKQFIKYVNELNINLDNYPYIYSYDDNSIVNNLAPGYNYYNAKNGNKIELNSNEYVYSENSIELEKGNYIIKTI